MPNGGKLCILSLLVASNIWATSYTISPPSIRVEKGDTFTVSVKLCDVRDSVVSDCWIRFNPTSLNIEAIEKGTDTIFSWFAGKREDSTIIMMTGVTLGNPPVSGSGSIATIKIKALENGIFPLEFDLSNTKILDKDGQRIPYIPYNSTITVVPLDRFVIEEIPSPQVAQIEIPLKITGFDKNNNVKTAFSEDAYLSCLSGDISPKTITFTSGIWNGSITILNPPNGGTETIAISCYSVRNYSNPFLFLSNNEKGFCVKEEQVALEISPHSLGTNSIISIATLTELPVEIPTSTIKVGNLILDINATSQNGEELGT
ncbi:MAG: cohesin domain-containing protein, partial [bacterium]